MLGEFLIANYKKFSQVENILVIGHSRCGGIERPMSLRGYGSVEKGANIIGSWYQNDKTKQANNIIKAGRSQDQLMRSLQL